MARRAGAQAAAQPVKRPATTAPAPSPALRVADAPVRWWAVVGGGTLAMVVLIVTALVALAALHAELVENQAALDEQLELNRLRSERVDELTARIAYLDSPEGLTEQARAAGLVPAAELVTLAPISPGALPPPAADPFGLAGLPPAADDPVDADPLDVVNPPPAPIASTGGAG